jgi:L-amino acid N-acyltransferase YncA
MAIVDDIAVLYIDSVLPWARGKGIQRLLMRARLSDAVELGCRVAVVEARPGTASSVNAERVGFEIAYVRTSYARGGRGTAGAV